MLDEGTGIVRRKKLQRATAERAAIVVESYAVGASVAQCHGRSRPRNFRVGSAARQQRPCGATQFAEVALVPDLAHFTTSTYDGIEVITGSVVIRLPKSTTPKRIADIAHCL